LKGAIAGAWLAGTGLVIWRQLRGGQHLPVPGALLAVTGLFAALGIVADIVPASRQFVVVTAWGIDIAGLFNLWPAGLGGEVQQAAATGTGGVTGTSTASGFGTTQAPGTSTAAGRG
jgi:hypothetical protein